MPLRFCGSSVRAAMDEAGSISCLAALRQLRRAMRAAWPPRRRQAHAGAAAAGARGSRGYWRLPRRGPRRRSAVAALPRHRLSRFQALHFLHRLSSGRPLRLRYACSAAITEGFSAFRGHGGSLPSTPVIVSGSCGLPSSSPLSTNCHPWPVALNFLACDYSAIAHCLRQVQFRVRRPAPKSPAPPERG